MATVRERRSVSATAEGARSATARKGMVVPRVFSTAGVSPYDEVEWELRTAVITGERGEVVFEQKEVEVPAFWSQLATACSEGSAW